jgi:hypothetical protein
MPSNAVQQRGRMASSILSNPTAIPMTGGLSISQDERKWEDLNADEKVEKLMVVTTHLFNQINRLEREITHLRSHRHNSYGDPVVEKMIGVFDEDIDMPRVTKNPFNVSRP